VKLGEGATPSAGVQGEREARPSGRVEREPIVRGGTRQLRVSVGVGETAGDTTQAIASRILVDNRRGAGGLERGTRTLGGERSEGGRPGGSGVKQTRELERASRTAGRVRNPESGTGAVVGNPARRGASSSRVVVGSRNLGRVGPPGADGREDVRDSVGESGPMRMNRRVTQPAGTRSRERSGTQLVSGSLQSTPRRLLLASYNAQGWITP